MFTKAQVQSFSKALAGAEKYEPMIERLAQIAERSPQFKDRIDALRVKLEHAKAVAQIALATDPMGS